ncbi:MAG: SRPBCC family protein [Bacteroidota bacterium]
MRFYSIKKKQHLPISLKEAWAFFSSPNNLQKITPARMNFTVTSDKKEGENMHIGQIITYTLTPVLGIRVKWMTEITHIKEGHYFIDEQRFGPYKLWHHKHTFVETPNGVDMYDDVNYVLPLGFLGTIAHSLFVKKQLEHVFIYRTKVTEELFGK